MDGFLSAPALCVAEFDEFIKPVDGEPGTALSDAIAAVSQENWEVRQSEYSGRLALTATVHGAPAPRWMGFADFCVQTYDDPISPLAMARVVLASQAPALHRELERANKRIDELKSKNDTLARATDRSNSEASLLRAELARLKDVEAATQSPADGGLLDKLIAQTERAARLELILRRARQKYEQRGAYALSSADFAE